MKPGSPAVQALPAPSQPRGRDFIFPERATPTRLRQLRDRLQRRGLVAEALQVARRLAEKLPGRESYWKLGTLERLSGLHRKALKTLRDALRFRDGAAYLLPEIHVQIAAVWHCLRDHKRMGEALERSRALRPKTRTEPNLHLSFGNLYLARGDFRRALESFRDSERAARNALERARALGNQGAAWWHLRDLEAAGRCLDAAIAGYQAAGHLPGLVWARRIRAAFHLDQGRPALALGMVERAIEVALRAGIREELPSLFSNAGYFAGELGEWERSLRLLDRGLEKLDRGDDPRVEATALALRATALANLARFEESSRSLADAKRAARGERDWVSTMHLSRAQARIAALRGDWAEVRRHARSAERLAAKVKDLPRLAEFRELRARAETELGRRRAALHAAQSAQRLRGLGVRGSALTRRLRAAAERLAKSSVNVLLSGEAGTGKTQLAKEMHLAGPRAQGPCVVAPCEQLAFPASDLMGHVAGAWSGARSDSAGLAGRAKGGTLVLDRVDELTPEEQRALVPLAEGRVRPVGGTEERRLEARILATCREPGRLIPELRARLAGALLELPALRLRAEDVPVAVRRMLPDGVGVTGDALALLAAHPWEGNLSELRSKLELLASLSKGLPIGVKVVKAALRPAKADRRERERRRLADLAEALR